MPNNVSPKFKKIYLTKEEDISLLENIGNNWVDLFISNSLLINNRKLRRKLEVLLKEGNFETVDYLDDITVDIVDGGDEMNEQIMESNSTSDVVSINLDFIDYIKNYIETQTWGIDKVKDGVLNEFTAIVDIYNESNKKI